MLCVMFAFTPELFSQTPLTLIQRENSKPGTRDWWLMLNRAHDRSSLTDTNIEIEGYASLTSVNRGGSISFYVNTPEPSYTFEVFRLGWYQSTGARRMTAPVQLTGRIQAMPTPAQNNALLLECNWTHPYRITIPTNAPDADGWVSGFYFAKLTASTSQKQVYIPFIVRDDQRASTYLYQWPCATYQAYNFWAGLSLYGNAYTNLPGLPHKVSFNRPYTFLYQYFDWESMMVSFLERQGYDVTYCSSVDLHEQPNLLLNHGVYMTVGHDEYWSWPMRQNVETARDSGVSLGIFAGNTCYWQVRFEPSSSTSAPDRTMVCYKETAFQLDPFASGNPTNYPYITTFWRRNSVKPPEDAFLGILFGYQNGTPTNMVIRAPSHWVCAGTGLTNGSLIPGIIGYEVDGLGQHTPLGTALLAHSPVMASSGTNWLYGFSDMTIYTSPSGADVLDSGTIEWTFGLDANPWIGTPTSPNRTVTQMTWNILARLARCAGPQRNMVSWWAGEGNGLDELGRNAATFPQGVSYTNGMVGQAFWFSGTNQYAVATNASTNMITSQVSVDMWLLPPGPPASGGVLFAAADTNGSPWYVVALAPDGTLQVQLTSTNSGGLLQTSYSSEAAAIRPGQMQHLAITANLTNNQVRSFVNGLPLVLGRQSGAPPAPDSVFPNAGQFYIGGVPQLSPTNFYRGLIDEVGLYGRVLATNEISAIYNARGGGHCSEEASLKFTTSGGTNLLTWPLAALGFNLQSTTNLSGPWTQETNSIVMNGDTFVFAFNPASGQKYFRLSKIVN